MKDEFISKIGIWGQRHYYYLKKHSPTVLNVMRLKGTLEQYLTDLDRDAQESYEMLSVNTQRSRASQRRSKQQIILNGRAA